MWLYTVHMLYLLYSSWGGYITLAIEGFGDFSFLLIIIIRILFKSKDPTMTLTQLHLLLVMITKTEKTMVLFIS